MTTTKQGRKDLQLPSALALTGILTLALQTGLAAAVPEATSIEFNRDIRPILSDKCFACHGPDKNTRMADLRLDVREDAIAKGALTPGKPDKSKLLARILAPENSPLRMPPAAFHKTLSREEKDLLRRWIAAGAKYQPHWAYIPPKRPPLPPGTASHPLDRFILAEVKKAGLKPSPLADRRTLLRRLSLDLTGLPPTPAEVAAFLADSSPDAYKKQVERLLASPHYGERMAVPWLDAVRYAHGRLPWRPESECLGLSRLCSELL